MWFDSHVQSRICHIVYHIMSEGYKTKQIGINIMALRWCLHCILVYRLYMYYPYLEEDTTICVTRYKQGYL